jgi:hypothetical protein
VTGFDGNEVPSWFLEFQKGMKRSILKVGESQSGMERRILGIGENEGD